MAESSECKSLQGLRQAYAKMMQDPEFRQRLEKIREKAKALLNDPKHVESAKQFWNRRRSKQEVMQSCQD